MNQNIATVTLERQLTAIDLYEKTFLMSSVVAELENVGQSAAVFIISIPVTTPQPLVDTPKFEKLMYQGNLTNGADRELNIENIVLNSSTYTNDIEFSMQGGNY